jgi:5-hydroxyisourate hydrolase
LSESVTLAIIFLREENLIVSRRNFLFAGLSLGALAAIPLRTLAQEKSQDVALEIPSHIIAQGESQNHVTTHVLDMMRGKSGSGMRIDFSILEGDRYRLIKTFTTNENGRTDEPMLSGNAIAVGRYEMMFYIADYYKKLGVELPDPPFFDKVPVHFAIFDAAQSYHVPLICTPWTYSTYRGSISTSKK